MKRVEIIGNIIGLYLVYRGETLLTCGNGRTRYIVYDSDRKEVRCEEIERIERVKRLIDYEELGEEIKREIDGLRNKKE